jgi:hypothetical protein
VSALFWLFILAAAPAGAVVDLVFDLDWTLFYTTTQESVRQDANRTYEYDHVYYRMTPDAPEVLLQLQKQGFRLSTFSGGKNERNDFLVAQLVRESATLPGGPLRFYRQLGFNELSRRENPTSARFADTYMKDLSQINPDLESVVLIDDMLKFSPVGQERNLLWLSKAYNDRLFFDSGRAGEKFEAATAADWQEERYKLHFVLKTLSEIQRQSAAQGQSFVKNLSKQMRLLHPLCKGLFL